MRYTNQFIEQFHPDVVSKVEDLDLLDHEYTPEQVYEITQGIEQELDISWYANPLFTDDQMSVIRNTMENNLDVSKVADLNKTYNEMVDALEQLMIEQVEIQELLDISADKGYDLRPFVEGQTFTKPQILTLIKAYEDGLDVEYLSDANLSVEQMEMIGFGMNEGIILPKYLTTDEMNKLIEDQINHLKTTNVYNWLNDI